MSRRIRTLLVCWLTVALPLQGIAAQSMLWCGPAHHAAAAEAVEVSDHCQHCQYSHYAGSDHEGMTHDDSAQPAGGKTHQVATSKCAVCAACCSAVAMPSSTLSFAVVHGEPSYDTRPAAMQAGVVAGGLERPPKHPA
jgi:hypothetical protein